VLVDEMFDVGQVTFKWWSRVAVMTSIQLESSNAKNMEAQDDALYLFTFAFNTEFTDEMDELK
jgi:hypothetical protein